VQPVAPAASASEQAAASEAPVETNALSINPSVSREISTSKTKKAAIASSDADVVSTEKPAAAPHAIVVKSASQKSAAEAAQPATEDAAPTLDMASNSGNDAISDLVNVSPAVPHAATQTVKVSQGISQGLLVKKVPPVYPQQAMQMRIQGAVQIAATISKSGDVSNLKLINGDPILGRAAMTAVKQWKYKPYYLDSEPVEIQTQITVNFKLP
jgi:TonB family protein